MKIVLVFVVSFVTLASSYPASEKLDLPDVDFDTFGGQEPVVDTGYFTGYYPLLDSFNKRLQDIITRLRQSIASEPTDIISSFGDLGKGNTTSYTKIVGNHKVEVNETEYKKDTDFGTSHVKISYVNVRPLHPDTIEPDTNTEADAEPFSKPADRDRESLEDSVENEIPNNIDEAKNMEIETFEDLINSNNNQRESLEEIPSFPYKQLAGGIEDIDNDIDRNIQNLEPMPLIDLSNDIRVNDIMLADGVPLNPHAEFIN